jgi:multidrug efflux pump subunit AcrB
MLTALSADDRTAYLDYLTDVTWLSEADRTQFLDDIKTRPPVIFNNVSLAQREHLLGDGLGKSSAAALRQVLGLDEKFKTAAAKNASELQKQYGRVLDNLLTVIAIGAWARFFFVFFLFFLVVFFWLVRSNFMSRSGRRFFIMKVLRPQKISQNARA